MNFRNTRFARRKISTLLIMAILVACQASTTPTEIASLGTPSSREKLLESIAKKPTVRFRKWTSASWIVPLGGLLNLNHPKVIAAKIEDREEPIEIYVYSLTHPKFGTYLVDSGVSTLFLEESGNPLISMIVARAMNMGQLVVEKTTTDIAKALGGIDGVFLTHIHLDHIMGLTDLPSSTPVYIGPGDAAAKAGLNALTIGSTDRLLATQGRLKEWDYSHAKVLDIFGDGSVFAIHSPGHTPGATAYFVNSTAGPQLLLGDTTHTRWGWENGVEAGSFSADIPTSAKSLGWLKALALELPEATAHPGHQ
ncbi:MAG: MBL fold metallo-hydrolase [Pseudomonadota bacterium]